MNAELASYEATHGQKRHDQNIGKFDELFGLLNQLKGSFFALKIIAAFVAFLCMAILALLSYLGTHRTGASMITHSSTAQASNSTESSVDGR